MNKRSLLMLVLMAIAVCLASVGVGAAEEVHITLAGNYAKVEDACGVAVAGNYAYVVDKNNGLVIVDVSNPAAPIRVGSYDSEYATDVAVSGSYAYFAGYDGLVIFDMRNPASPVLAGIL